ncbi:hypothetical protein BH24CHL1_BH24CHL1_12430 [soil metagenome]
MSAQPERRIEGRTFEHVVSRGPVSIYRGPDTYLRIGPGEVLREEADSHKHLWRLGFPVGKLIAEGEHESLFYYIEESAGATFGDIFDAEAQRSGSIRPESFEAFQNIVLTYAGAQLRNVSPVDAKDDFQRTVHVSQVTQIFPDFAEQTARVFTQVAERLRVFPTVLTHGDFHAFNVCERGVIDVESVAWGFAGYDVITAILLPGLFPLAEDEFSYSQEQLDGYLAAIDDLYMSHGFERPSNYARDFLIAKMMWLVAGRQRPEKLLGWMDNQYQEMLNAYSQASL